MSSIEKALKICCEMFTQRGYKDVVQKDNEITAKNREDDNVICKVIYDKISSKNIKDIVMTMEDENMKHIVVIYEDEITSPAKNIINDYKEKILEMFSVKELQINITKHRLQPKFELLTKEEAILIKKKMGLKFPIMFETGPISRFFYFRRDDMIRIIYKNGYINYRIIK